MRCILYLLKSCWLFWDRAQNMLIFGRRCSTPFNFLQIANTQKMKYWKGWNLSLFWTIRYTEMCWKWGQRFSDHFIFCFLTFSITWFSWRLLSCAILELRNRKIVELKLEKQTKSVLDWLISGFDIIACASGKTHLSRLHCS